MNTTHATAAAVIAASFTAATHAATFGAVVPSPGTFIDAGNADMYTQVSGALMEARFKAATTNWESRLETDGSPNNGDLVGHVANGQGNFEGRSFGFDFTYDAADAELTWSITRVANGNVTTLTRNAAPAGDANTIEFFTSGSRAIVDVTDLTFSNASGSTAWPELDTSPNGPTFSKAVLYLDDDLMSGDWSLSGSVNFDAFTKSNPDEGAKVVAKLYRGDFTIPAPGTFALIGAAGVATARRRRRG